MAGEKYIVATTENPVQISVRNILNPYGYTFLGNCSDPVSLIRLTRSYQPDFIVVDTNLKIGELKRYLEAIDDEMLCACVVIGEYKDMDIANLLENSRVISFCPKPLNRELFIHTVEMALINYRRIYSLNKKLKEMIENYETRKAVDRAKGILMKLHGLSENEAYEKIRKKSMDTRTSMKDIAEAIIFTHDIMNE